MAAINPSTAGMADKSQKAKTSSPAINYDYISRIRDLVKIELTNFPYLLKAPDAMYYIMATFGAESGWKLWHGNPLSSRHLTVVKPSDSSLIQAYENSDVIRNIRGNSSTTLQTLENVKDGWYAHGISATMGCYYVRGSHENKLEWRSYPEAVSRINALGLEVDPGQSINDTLFPTDTESSWLKSIVSGLIIFNSKYRIGLVQCRGDAVAAMQFAIGSYLGKKGARDANNTSPDDRRRDINTNQGRISILADIKVVRSGSTASNKVIDMGDKSLPANGATRVDNNTASAATTNSGSNGKSETGSGCGKA